MAPPTPKGSPPTIAAEIALPAAPVDAHRSLSPPHRLRHHNNRIRWPLPQHELLFRRSQSPSPQIMQPRMLRCGDEELKVLQPSQRLRSRREDVDEADNGAGGLMLLSQPDTEGLGWRWACAASFQHIAVPKRSWL